MGTVDLRREPDLATQSLKFFGAECTIHACYTRCRRHLAVETSVPERFLGKVKTLGGCRRLEVAVILFYLLVSLSVTSVMNAVNYLC